MSIYAATGGPALKMVPVSAESGLATGDVEEIVTLGIASARHLSLSPDGRSIALAAMDFGSQIWTTSMKADAIAGASAPVPRGKDAPSIGAGVLAGWRVARVLVEPYRRRDRKSGSSTQAVAGRCLSLSTSSSHRRRIRPPVLDAWRPGDFFLSGGKEFVRALKINLDVRRETTILDVPTANGPDGTPLPVPDLVVSPDGSAAAYSQIDPATGRPRLYVRRLSEPAAHTVTNGECVGTFSGVVA